MATLEQIGEALRRADAAGNVEDARALAAAYKQMQTPGAVAAPSDAYSAATTAASDAGLKGKVEGLPSQRPSLGDEVMSFGRGIIEGVPVVGPALADARRGLDANVMAALHGGNAGDYQDEFKAADEDLRAETGGARTAGGLTGSILSLAGLGSTAAGGTLLGMTGGTGARVGMGALSGGALSGADTLARGGSPGDALLNSAVGALLGGALPAAGAAIGKAGQKAAQSKAVTAAIKDAPAASELKSTASKMFQAVDDAGVQVAPEAFRDMVISTAQAAASKRISPKLDPKAYGAFEEMGGLLGEVMQGRPLTLSDLHNLRQIAQRAAVSSEGRDAYFANGIVDAIDDFVAKPGSTVASNAAGDGKVLLNAIDTWGRAKRVGLIEEAIEKAKVAASGTENGLRVEFRKILRNPKLRAQFTSPELAEIAKVAQGSATANLAKLLGGFGFNLGGNGGGNVVGGSIGLLVGGLPLAAVGAASRKGAEKLTVAAAERAAKTVATPGIPTVTPKAAGPALVAPAVLPLEATKRRQPIEIVVTGGSNS